MKNRTKIQRISIEESKKYLPIEECDEDTVVYFFTLEQSNKGQGWESVNYYSNIIK